MTAEKVSVNMNDEVLSKVDLLVEDGFYANRSDFINRAVQQQLDRESATIDKLLVIHSKEKINENQWFIGIQTIGRAYLEEVKSQGLHLKIKGCGVLYFDKDVDAALIYNTVDMISSKIRLFADAEVREHYRPEKKGRGE